MRKVHKGAKQTGTLYESMFMPACLGKGLHPHDTLGDYLQHDLLVMNDAGCVFKVQVKGTNSAISDRLVMPKYRITAKHGSKVSKKGSLGAIDCTKVDVLAAYVEPLDVWYLIPCLAIVNMAVWLFPHNPKSKARYEKYKDNWDCFF